MDKAGFIIWLQGLVDEMADSEGDAGAVWNHIEMEGLLRKIGVRCAWDQIGHLMFFRCADGLLVSHYEMEIDEWLIWPFEEHRVENNMFVEDGADVQRAIRAAESSAKELLSLLED